MALTGEHPDLKSGAGVKAGVRILHLPHVLEIGFASPAKGLESN